MKKNITILLFSLIFGINNIQAIPPEFSLKASGGVYDFILENNLLYVATDNGIIDIFNVKTRKKVKQFSLPQIKDFTGKNIPAKIFSIDKIINKDILLVTSQGNEGFTDVYIIENGKISKLFGQKDKLPIKRAVFIDRQTIFLGLLSSEIILYDLISKKQIYRKQLSTAVFSNFTTDITKALAITCEESGKLRFINIRTGKTIEIFKGQNLDNVYQTAYSKLTFVTAGQDRKVGVYKFNGDSYSLHADFLIYSVGISPSARFGAYPANENNDIVVFNINTKQKKTTLKGQKSTLTKIHFIDDNNIITSSEDPYIMFWKI